MFRNPKPQYGSDRKYRTTVEIDGSEFDVEVIYDMSRPEPDVNYAGGIEITGIYHEDNGCIMDELTEDQVNQIHDEIEEYGTSSAEDYGDYLRDRARDDALTGDR